MRGPSNLDHLGARREAALREFSKKSARTIDFGPSLSHHWNTEWLFYNVLPMRMR